VPDHARLLLEVAEAIADRTPIDWTAVHQQRTPRADRLLAAFRAIDDVACETRGGRPITAVPALRSAIPPSTLGAAAACVLGIAAGLAGAVWGEPDAGGVPIAWQLAGALTFGAMGFWLLVGSNERRGMWLGAWYLSMAAAVSYRPAQWLLPLASGEGPWQAVIAGFVPEVFMPLFLALFVRGFPRPTLWSPVDRLANITIVAAALSGAACGLGHAWAASRWPLNPAGDARFGWMARNHDPDYYWALLLTPAAFALALMISRGRRVEGEERRRGALFLAGIVLGLAPTILVIFLDATSAWMARILADPRGLGAVACLTYGVALTTPFTTAYAIRAHRVVSVHFVVRGAIRRLLARSTLTLLTLVPLALLAAHLFRNSDLSLAALLSGGQARLSLSLAALGLLSVAASIPLRQKIDRALSPPRGDWRASLFRVNQNLRRARSVEEVLDLVMREVEVTLGARSCVMLPTGIDYVSLRGRVPRIPCDSALIQIARSAEGPFLVDPGSRRSLYKWLPEPERSIVVDGAVAVILPIPGNEGPRALLTLEAMSDSEPYSAEDLLYLGALGTAGSIALDTAAMERRPIATFPSLCEEPAGECRRCGLLEAMPAAMCRCGAPLEEALLPLLLNGKFRLTRRLGAGAMGVAYEAEDLDLARTVALKTLPKVSPDLALRLRKEARSMARVLHPRLATIFGCESWRGVPVLVLEHLAGTLSARIECPWRIREAFDLGIAAAEGLAAMHDHGLLHRDIKPSNVGFGHDGSVKLLDFGIAHLLTEAVDQSLTEQAAAHDSPAPEDLDLSSRAIGTPLYCSPERLSGRPAGPSDDVWSLSLVVYELIAGRHPWRSRDGAGARIGPIPDLRELRGDCPVEVAQLFTRALAPCPGDRFASARDLRVAASHLLRGLPFADTWPA
jgi:hypothetical protein